MRLFMFQHVVQGNIVIFLISLSPPPQQQTQFFVFADGLFKDTSINMLVLNVYP